MVALRKAGVHCEPTGAILLVLSSLAFVNSSGQVYSDQLPNHSELLILLSNLFFFVTLLLWAFVSIRARLAQSVFMEEQKCQIQISLQDAEGRRGSAGAGAGGCRGGRRGREAGCAQSSHYLYTFFAVISLEKAQFR